MASLSNYLENKIIDLIFRSATFAKPTVLAIALFTSGPTDAGGGTEVSGGGYVRQTLNPSDSNWNATQGGTSGVSTGTSGSTSNALVITFPTPTASWGLVTHIGIFDAVAGGNLLLHGPLTTAKQIEIGEVTKLSAGDLVNILA